MASVQKCPMGQCATMESLCPIPIWDTFGTFWTPQYSCPKPLLDNVLSRVVLTKRNPEYITFSDILGLLKLADCYCETVLRKECELILMQNINSENAFFLFENAYLANATVIIVT